MFVQKSMPIKGIHKCQVCLQWLHWIQFCGQIKLGRAAEDKFALGMFAVMIAAPELNCKYERELCHSWLVNLFSLNSWLVGFTYACLKIKSRPNNCSFWCKTVRTFVNSLKRERNFKKLSLWSILIQLVFQSRFFPGAHATHLHWQESNNMNEL